MEANTEKTETKGRSQSRARNRPERVPLHSRDILTVWKKKPDKEYRWVINRDDRLYRFKQAGWEFVTDANLEVGEPTVNADKELGTVIVKKTGGDELYLMCIDKEWYDEDQKIKQERVDGTEQAMYEQLNSSSDGRYGEVKIGYNPSD